MVKTSRNDDKSIHVETLVSEEALHGEVTKTARKRRTVQRYGAVKWHHKVARPFDLSS